MSAAVSKVFLRDGASGELAAAELFDAILPAHLDQHEQHWKPAVASDDVEHGHWDWRAKWADCSQQPSQRGFAIECAGLAQGLMIVDTLKPCRTASQAGKRLVYVEYLETAPWNRGACQRFKGVGTVLIAAAIQLSIVEGHQGRIGLHSLPQADDFYRFRCGMSDFGPDASYYPEFPLRYFEMTDEQAAIYLKGRA